MARKLFIAFIAVVLLTGGSISAAEIGLASVMYPDGKNIDVPLAGLCVNLKRPNPRTRRQPQQ